MERYDECEEDINEAVKILQNPIFPLITALIPDSEDKKMLEHLKNLACQLKELDAYNLTESEDKYIIERRKKCLREALDALNHNTHDSVVSSHLNIIMEKSSVSESVLEPDLNSIFLLRSYRKILQNWVNEDFSLESLEETTDLAFIMVKSKPK